MNNRAIGIDIGGTKMAVAAVDETGAIHKSVVLPTEPELGFEPATHRLIDAVLTITSQAGWWIEDLCGIGIGCAGPVDPVRGIINNPYTLPGWDNCDIVTPLRQRFGMLPVILENDADAALLGECFTGAGLGCDPVVMLTFGTGIGGAALVGGRIVHGAAGGHPEIGHMLVEPQGPKCYCGMGGCLESIASGTAISQAGRQAGIGDSHAVFAAATRGVPEAVAIVERAINATRIAAWNLIHTFMPQRIILGGGLMDEYYDCFAQPVREAIQQAAQAPKGQISVERAALGDNAGLVGASRLAIGAVNLTSG